ncbi:Uncharacterized protein YfkK, UPF0435 family [Paenibacillus sp. UNCCL117]|uniref:DUF1128 domain-containing protein n=1 Tax=unclassified Paenibacillus TaxID=185978 RepID=UPI0008870536|nr:MULTISPECIES: DUF1128 domain-containing protein [unclassified Paenibacillus]SDD92661.1 Uncharacterized protein YfkK, UPF0435 family [Paenibacillus sp. cl123]SFW43408.1 Uncharacterized protein YfkK, UPF0435 family [Paenibacillus sp. UNCCL117]
MDLTQNTLENTAYMIEEIKKKLRMASGAALKATSLSDELYEDLHDIYSMVASKNRFSISEIEAITSELGRLRRV